MSSYNNHITPKRGIIAGGIAGLAGLAFTLGSGGDSAYSNIQNPASCETASIVEQYAGKPNAENNIYDLLIQRGEKPSTDFTGDGNLNDQDTRYEAASINFGYIADFVAVAFAIEDIDSGAYRSVLNGAEEIGRSPYVLEDGSPVGEWVKLRIPGGKDALLDKYIGQLSSSPLVLEIAKDPYTPWCPPLSEPLIIQGSEQAAGATYPNDPAWPYQWGLQEMNMPASWVYLTKGSSDVKVAVLDIGFDVAHEDLSHIAGMPKYNSRQGQDSDNVLPDENNPFDLTPYHGNMVMGIVGAKLDNGIGIAGIAPNVTTMLVKWCSGLFCSGEDLVNAITWAAENGANVITNSVGSAYYAPIDDAILDAFYNHNVAIFMAAGNDNQEGADYPANLQGVLPVGSVNQYLTRSEFSNWGDNFIFAPGEDIVSTGLPGAEPYRIASGTSFASPHAAGLAALYLSYVPGAYRWPFYVFNYVAASARHLESGLYFAQVYADDFVGTNCRQFDVAIDTKIDGLDTQAIAFRWLQEVGDTFYRPQYDFDGNGVINTFDLQKAFIKFAMECPY